MTYETLILAEPTLDAGGIEDLQKKVSAQIEKVGGTIQNVDEWGVRRLAYEIAKHTDGYYVLYQWDGPGQAVAPLRESLKLLNPVLRFKTTRKPELKRPMPDLSQLSDRDHRRGRRG